MTVPTLGTTLLLKENWTFEGKYFFLEGLREKEPPYFKQYLAQDLIDYIPITIPKETVLRVEKFIIDKGWYTQDTITFKVIKCAVCPTIEKEKFWAKIEDVNEIVCEWLNYSLPKRIKKLEIPSIIEIPSEKMPFFEHRIPADLYQKIQVNIEINQMKNFIVKLDEGNLRVYEIVNGVEQKAFSE